MNLPPLPEPSEEQMKQLLDGLNGCSHRASRYEFMRTWIRDWTAHKLEACRKQGCIHDAEWLARRTQEAYEQGRKQALEEAAQKCDAEFFNATKRDGASSGVAAGNCAEAIRSMK